MCRHYTPKAYQSVLQIGGMPTLEVFGAVSAVSACPPAWALSLLRGHFGCPAWAFSGASYFRIAVCVSKNHVFYFDPLAAFEHATNEIQTFFKRFDKHLIFNNLRIQSYDSSKCGIHCLVFCFIMSIKPTLRTYTKYLKSFLPYKVEEREKLSLLYFSILGTHKKGKQ